MTNTIIIVLLILNIVFSIYTLYKTKTLENKTYLQNDNQSTDFAKPNEEYYVYIGLNDSTSGTQLVTTEEVIDFIDSISRKHCQGYTISNGQGRWFDDENVYYENCLICHYDNIPESAVYSMSDQIVKKFNQECVFIKHDRIKSEYYYGNK